MPQLVLYRNSHSIDDCSPTVVQRLPKCAQLLPKVGQLLPKVGQSLPKVDQLLPNIDQLSRRDIVQQAASGENNLAEETESKRVQNSAIPNITPRSNQARLEPRFARHSASHRSMLSHCHMT